MDPTDILLTLVEISIALAGFASLVTASGRRKDDERWKQNTEKLRLMLEQTLRVAAIALVAIPFIQQAPPGAQALPRSVPGRRIGASNHGVERV